MDKKCKEILIQELKKVKIFHVNRTKKDWVQTNKWGKPLKIMSIDQENKINNNAINRVLKQIFPEDYK